MDTESLFHRLSSDLRPSADQKHRVQSIVQKRIAAPELFRAAHAHLAPTKQQRETIWADVHRRIAFPAISSLFDRVRTILTDSRAESPLRSTLVTRMHLRTAPVPYSFTKWVAAVLIVAVAVQSRVIFLPPQTSAESPVIFRPTRGSVELSSHNLWQPVLKEIEITQPVALKTNDGEATILLRDNGNVRLSAQTTLTLNDVHITTAGPTVTLSAGKVWVQSMIPHQLQGMTISTRAGIIELHNGSVSISSTDKGVRVEVWDRSAEVQHAGRIISMIAGEYVDLTQKGASDIQLASDSAYRAPWVAQNLNRDAVHQQELAQLQQERRAAEAGILPTSPLYAVKRAAESVDVFLTFGSEARLEKRLQQASTRLNEAAALLASGASGATTTLAEYKETLLAVAGSGDLIAQRLIQEEVAQNTAQLSAALPDDLIYPLKETVLEASTSIPNASVNKHDVEETLLVDGLDALHDAVRMGNNDRTQSLLVAMAPSLTALKRGELELTPDTRRETNALLTSVVQHIEQKPEPGTEVLSHEVTQSLLAYLPESQTHAVTTAVVSYHIMTDEELNVAVNTTLSNIFETYKMTQSRMNALRAELLKYKNSPDEGRYLRKLLEDLPEESPLRPLVRHSIQVLRQDNILNGVVDTTNQPPL